MQRDVQPELLDSLPHDDPAAVRSRAELRMINGLMGNHRWIARQLRRVRQPEWRVMELGAGDGLLAQRLIDNGLCTVPTMTAVDLAPPPQNWPASARWLQGDLFSLPRLPDAEIVVANLFLHHFQAAQLAELGKRFPDTCRVLIFSEPARRSLHLWQGHALALLTQLSHVTNHDMLISIRAGFLHDELPHSLGLQGWRCEVSHSPLGAYRMVATR